jgi:hypothetical protein
MHAVTSPTVKFKAWRSFTKVTTSPTHFDFSLREARFQASLALSEPSNEYADVQNSKANVGATKPKQNRRNFFTFCSPLFSNRLIMLLPDLDKPQRRNHRIAVKPRQRHRLRMRTMTQRVL